MNRIKTYARIFSISMCCVFIFSGTTVQAKKTFQDANQSLGIVADKTGHEKTTVGEFIPKVIKTAFAAVGATFLALMVYAGMKWMLARGNEDNITTARSTLVNATIGLIVIAAAYTITSFITTRVIQGNGAGSGSGLNKYGQEPIGCCEFETKSAWGSAMITKTQCTQWKETHSNVLLIDWNVGMSAVACKKSEEEKNAILDKLVPSINLGG